MWTYPIKRGAHKVESQKYLANSLSDSQGTVVLDNWDQVGSRRLVLPGGKMILTLLGSTANWRAQPHERAQPLSLCVCLYGNERAQPTLIPHKVWNKRLHRHRKSPSQTPNGDSSLLQTTNNLTFTEERRNKRDQSKQFTTMHFTAILESAEAQYIRKDGHERLLQRACVGLITSCYPNIFLSF